jgi:hypothetical protein
MSVFLKESVRVKDYKRLFHISMNDSITHLTARVPNDVLANKKDALENFTIPRTCVALSIDGCILGLQINSRHFKTNDPNETILFTVYEPVNYDSLILKTNQELIDEKLVFDAHITGEVWILNPSIEVKKIASIRVYKEITKEINYKPILKDPNKTKWLKHDGTLDTYLRKWEYVK